MRRFFVLIMMCLLPLQVSWAAVTDYCEHEQGKAAQHFGHHVDEHKAFSEKSDSGKQPGKFNLGHDHCHMSSFLGFPNEAVAHAPVPSALPSLRYDEHTYSFLALARPERPKWRTPA